MASIDELLALNDSSELLRFSTAGSVDDGKSTLIGRLLYDCKSVYEDQLDSVKNSRVNRSGRAIDFSLLTDGLRAEREQGITIDVAYRYFSTPRRKFIIADTPGHEQYTRNMATGASTASVAVILIDARKGLLPQSRRHAYISALLGTPTLVAAINKMDLVDFSEQVYREIHDSFAAFCAKLGRTGVRSIPVSALDGDNVVTRSARTPWYDGPPLLEMLETVPLAAEREETGFRMPVQFVIRPNLDFRGFAGTIAAGVVHPGDRLMTLPSGRTSRVREISTWDGPLDEAAAPRSVCLTLEDEIDISRGDMLVDPRRMPHVSRRFEATLVWMSAAPLEAGRPYLLKHTTQQASCQVTRLRGRVSIDDLSESAADRLELNEIGVASIETTRPLFFDAYARNRATGSFILIDPVSNETLAAGMIAEPRATAVRQSGRDIARVETGRVTRAERFTRSGHLPATVWLTARSELALLLERRLFDRGCLVQALTDDLETHLLPEAARVLNGAGMIAICSAASDDEADRAEARELVGESTFFAPAELPASDLTAATAVLEMLESRGVFLPPDFSSGEGI